MSANFIPLTKLLLREGGCYCSGNPTHRNSAAFQAAGNISRRVYHLPTWNPKLLSESFTWKVCAEFPGSHQCPADLAPGSGTGHRGRCQREALTLELPGWSVTDLPSHAPPCHPSPSWRRHTDSWLQQQEDSQGFPCEPGLSSDPADKRSVL